MTGPVASATTFRGETVALRPLAEGEEVVDSSSAFDEWGDDRLPVEETAGVVHRLAVTADGRAVGVVSWHSAHYGPTARSLAWNIGIGLSEQAQGRGIGSVAQRLLAEYLFATTARNRVEASTDVANLAEQRALERAGFVREGVLRGAQGRADGQHDLVGYALLRTDL
jgi:RimJ/RimL family protein N-acetyltransferase